MKTLRPAGVGVAMSFRPASLIGRTLIVVPALCGALAIPSAHAEDAPAAAQPETAASETAASEQAQSPAAPAAAAPANADTRTFQINAYDVDGNTLLDELAIETAVYPYLGPGKTPNDVEAARAALEKAYQAHGYQSVIVQVPAQSVSAGIVKLHVTEARVGQVRVTGAEYHSESAVRDEMPSLQEGQVPNFNDVQRDLADVNRLPDRRVTPSLKPGQVPGTVDVELHVNDNLPVHASAEINNDHSPNTRELRTLATVRYDDLWNLGHSISATYLVAPQKPSNTEVFAASYRAPLWGTPWSLLAYGYVSDNAVATLGGTNVLGKGHTLGLRAILQLPYAASLSQSVNFGVDYKHFDQNLTLGPTSLQTPITYFPLSVVYSLQYLTDHATANLAITGALGIRGPGSSTRTFQLNRAFAQADFAVLKVDADYTETFNGGAEGVVRMAGQIANQPLVSSEQFSAGGNSSVRGYLQSEAVADDGVNASLELRTPSLAAHVGAPLEEWRFYGFVDAAHLWLLNPLAEQRSQFSLYSVGVGTRVAAFRYLRGDIALAIPLSDGPTTQAGDPAAIFSVKAEF